MTDRINTLIIKTPEGVEFSLRLAGPITRFLAWAIDLGAIIAMMSIINVLFTILGIISRDLAAAANIIGFFVITIGYGIFTEWCWQGQTLGKKLLRLRVMDAQGLRLQFSQVVIRNLLRFVDSLPALYLVGGLVCLSNRRVQRLGDLAANTIVTWNPRIPEPDLNQLIEGKYNSFHEYPHLEARLRQHVTPQEAQIAVQSIMRRSTLDPQARIVLFRELSAFFKTLVTFPQEATDGISDERYVRNVVEALFQPRGPKNGA
ncbi:MAG: RDD family protein [Desulfobacterales bacterium]|nr:RDD family protein [Desulfobacterales bacterium]